MHIKCTDLFFLWLGDCPKIKCSVSSMP